MRGTVLLLLSGLTLACVQSFPSLAETASTPVRSERDAYGEHIAAAAQRFRIPPVWIRTVLRVESNGDRRARSPKGAMGLMQIMPRTWNGLRVHHRLGNDPYDPHDNIAAGAAYIRELFDRYGSPGWVAAYNAGPGRYEASLKGRPLPAETRAYIAAIVPALEGRTDRRKQFAEADRPAWSRAPLFFAPADRRSTADFVQTDRSANDTAAAHRAIVPSRTTVRDVSAIVPQSDGLFITRTDAGRQP